jgi:hypothetical protein
MKKNVLRKRLMMIWVDDGVEVDGDSVDDGVDERG